MHAAMGGTGKSKAFENSQPPAATSPLIDLLLVLQERSYRFVTPTPATHLRMVRRQQKQIAVSLADIFGWSLPFAPALLDPELRTLLEDAEALERLPDGRARAKIRVSSLMGDLYLHSAFPTDHADAVFFGPDSYRFASLIVSELSQDPLPPHARILDIGTGAGVGAIVAARNCRADETIGTDVNPEALRYARLNARAAGVTVRMVEGTGLATASGAFDLIAANPPYLMDESRRRYRDGGSALGGEVSLRVAAEGLARLAPEGRLLLYTGSAIVAGRDPLGEELARIAESANCSFRYREIDPDVFGEELDRPAYQSVDRIALVAAVLTCRP